MDVEDNDVDDEFAGVIEADDESNVGANNSPACLQELSERRKKAREAAEREKTVWRATDGQRVLEGGAGAGGVNSGSNGTV